MTHPLFSLPKAELHLHIEGTLEPEMVFALAARNGLDLPFESVEDLRSRLEFTDLQSFLDLYFVCCEVLQTAADFEDLAFAYLERAHEQGVHHVEMFFDPQGHMARGVSIDAVLDGLIAALATAASRWGMTGGLILCFLRDMSVESAFEALDAVAHRTSDLIGVGLDSTEVGYPPELFEQVYARARSLGLHAVAHAGEEGGPEYVRGSIEALGVERVDHGIRTLDDAALTASLAARQIPFTVCPFSTVRLGGAASLAEHPLPRMIEAGLLVTINSDDPSYFGGYVGDNYVGVAETFGWGNETMAGLAGNSVTASFASDSRKAELHAAIAAWLAAQPG